MCLFNSVKHALTKNGFEFTTVADAGSLTGACIYLDLLDDLSMSIWQHTKTTVGVRFNASPYYMTLSNANQVIALMDIVYNIKGVC
jgi:hypothetical protein